MLLVLVYLQKLDLSTPCSAGQHGSGHPKGKNLGLVLAVCQAQGSLTAYLK